MHGAKDERSVRAERRQMKHSAMESILGKIHVDGSWHDTIVPSVLPVAPVERGTSPNILFHAPEQPDLPPPSIPWA